MSDDRRARRRESLRDLAVEYGVLHETIPAGVRRVVAQWCFGSVARGSSSLTVAVVYSRHRINPSLLWVHMMTTVAGSAVPGGPVPTLVGRGGELATLREGLDAALAGRGGLVLIGGEAGIGKTALAEALLAEARERGALALVGHCHDLAETPPYGPWAELLIRAPDLPGGPARPVFTAVAAGETATSQEALFAGVRDFLAALAARQPLALLLEDLHWADPASLDLLRVLGRQFADLPLLNLVTYRADELTRRHALYTLLPTLVRESRAVRLDLRPLDTVAIGALVAARYTLDGTDLAWLVRYLAGRTEGNALFLVELLRTLEGEGLLRPAGHRWALGDLAAAPVPALLRQVIEGRLARLGEAAERLLTVAAVIGQEVPLTLWATVSGVPADELVDLLDRTNAARLLTPTETGGRFAHALIREALYEGVSPLRRREWHRRVGEVLAVSAAPDPDAVAYHFRQAGDGRTAGWLVRAGERAQGAYAWATAAERYEAALPLLAGAGGDARERIMVLRRLAQTRFYVGTRHVLGYLEEAARLADTVGDPALVAAVRFELGMARAPVGSTERSLEELRSGLAVLATLPAGERARLAGEAYLGTAPDEHYYAGLLVLRLGLAGRFRETLALGEPLVARVAAGDVADSSAGHAYSGLAMAYAGLGRPDEARAASAQSRQAYHAAGHFVQVGLVVAREIGAVVLPYAADDLPARRQLAAEGERAATQASDLTNVTLVLVL